MMTEDEIVQDLFNDLLPEDLDYFKNLKDENLISLHHSFGRYIRNKYKLWERKWIPVIEDSCDVSDDHPDAISMRIIQKFHREANKLG